MRFSSLPSVDIPLRRSRVCPKRRGCPVRSRSRGASAVELALLFPFIMAILFGIIEFSFLLYDKAMITNAAREGARAGIVLRSPRLPLITPIAPCSGTSCTVKTIAEAYCANSMISIVGGQGCSATPIWTKVGGHTKTTPQPGDTLGVTVEYTYNGTALLALYSVMVGPLKIQSKSEMVYE